MEGTTFETLEKFKLEMEQYLIYYNELSPHQALNHRTPIQMNSACEKAVK